MRGPIYNRTIGDQCRYAGRRDDGYGRQLCQPRMNGTIAMCTHFEFRLPIALRSVWH
jgi:hypothetical protein